MSRKGTDSTSSLELLLDTICNMFGGIVLIFILLAVLSQFTARETQEAPDPGKKDEKGITREEWERQERQIASLTNAISQWLAKTGDPSNTVNSVPLPDIGLLEKQWSAAQTNLATLAQTLKELEEKRDTSSNELARVSIDRTGIVAEKSDRSPVFCAIRHNRLFFLHHIASPSLPRARSDRQVDFVPLSSGDVQVQLKRNLGQTIEPGCEDKGVLAEALANIDSGKEYIEFVVYPDSYEPFIYILSALRKRGFVYSWQPLPESEEIMITSSSSPIVHTIMR